MGPVFRAYDPDRDRLVVAKLFRLDLAPELVHRLVAAFERLIAASLTHPVIAAPMATGIVGNDAYLVQDYVAASSLDTAIRDYGPAPAADAVRLAAQLAGALDFGAVVEVWHGALHPRDVLVSPEQTRLTGLGVARALEQVGVTPPVRRPYSPPERIAGGAWDRRADVFSLAAVTHELLWGRRVVGAGAQAAEGLGELPGADTDALRTVFGCALAEDPAARFPTALAFAEALKDAFGTLQTASSDRLTSERKPPVEPLLPLDEPEPERAVPDLDLRPAAPAEAKLERVDTLGEANAARDEEPQVVAPPAPAPEPVAFEPPGPAPPAPAPPVRARHKPRALDGSERFVERARSSLWPLVLALIVGLAIGFAAGYGAGGRDHAQTAAVPAPPSAVAPTAAGRSLTAGAPSPIQAPAAPRQPPSPPPTASGTASRRPPPPASGRLLVRSTPAGAAVFVDGHERGRTPAAIRGLPPGEHQVVVVREGYVPAERRLALDVSRPAASMTVVLQREGNVPGATSDTGRFTGVLVIESRPAGAAAFVDGRRVGTTPLSMTGVDAGEHAVRLERAGYRRWTASVRIVAGERNRVTASLER